MKVFDNYAHYYDLLYRDKDYPKEAQFVHRLIQTYAPDARDILDLGCGTGTHAVLLAKEGYQIQGVDFSQEMLDRAGDRLLHLPPDLASKLKFTQGDIRDFKLSQTFDVVLSLFHVISYQTTNEDLQAAFANIKEHLKPGGILIFDIWYGPAVLSDRPTVRVKRLSDEAIEVTRIAEPVMYPNENLVDVNYQVFIKDQSSSAVAELRETHRMRYLFKPEITLFLAESGLKILDCAEWMSRHPPAFNTWGVYFVAQV